MPKIKVKLNLHEKPSGKIIKLGKIVEAELIECSEHEVKVQLTKVVLELLQGLILLQKDLL